MDSTRPGSESPALPIPPRVSSHEPVHSRRPHSLGPGDRRRVSGDRVPHKSREKSQTKELKRALHSVSEQLRLEKHRADEAESMIMQLAVRLKEVSQLRVLMQRPTIYLPIDTGRLTPKE